METSSTQLPWREVYSGAVPLLPAPAQDGFWVLAACLVPPVSHPAGLARPTLLHRIAAPPAQLACGKGVVLTLERARWGQGR